MQYRKLGSTNLQVSQTSLGTMTFGTTTSEKEAHRILDYALDIGINVIDTSNDYGNPHWGLSEQIIGNWLARNPSKRDRMILATKVYQEKQPPRLPNEAAGLSAYKIKRQIEESLSRLQTDRIDLYQVHHVDRTIRAEELWNTFEQLQSAGKMIYAGCSNYSGWMLAKHQLQARALGQLGFVSEQTMYNLFCRYAELELVPCAEDFGVGVLAYMPLAGGLLAGNDGSAMNSRASQVAQWYGLEEQRLKKSLAAYYALANDCGVQPNQLAIAWLLAKPAVASVLVGMRTIAQFAGLTEAVNLTLSPEAIQKLESLFPIHEGKPLRDLPAPEAYAW